MTENIVLIEGNASSVKDKYRVLCKCSERLFERQFIIGKSDFERSDG